jgi:hypothetical protein
MPAPLFFKTSTPARLKLIVKFRLQSPYETFKHYLIYETWYYFYEEDIARELMKLFDYTLDHMWKYCDWFQEDANELAPLLDYFRVKHQDKTPEELYQSRGKLLIKYRELIPKAYRDNILILPMLSFRQPLERSLLECLVQIRPSIVFHERTPSEIKRDRRLVQLAVRIDGYTLRHIDAEFISDRSLVMDAMRDNVTSFMYASPELKCDKELILWGLRRGCNTIIAKELSSDPDIAVQTLASIPEDMKSDRDIVLKMIRKKGILLKEASNELQADKQLVLIAVSNSGYIQYALDNWKDDLDVVRAHTNGYSNYSAHFSINNKSIAILVLRMKGDQLRNCSAELRNDREVVYAAVLQNGYIPARWWDDLDIVITAIIEYKCKSDDDEYIFSAITSASLYVNSKSRYISYHSRRISAG